MISDLRNHSEGKLVLGPLDRSTHSWFQGNPEEKVRYVISCIKRTAEGATALNVSCERASRFDLEFPTTNVGLMQFDKAFIRSVLT
jgi:hypothetical protein